MPLARLLTGHGEEIPDHAQLVRRRLGDHRRRCNKIVEALRDGPKTAWEIATRLWSRRTVSTQSVLVVWEVLGHLDLLLDAGCVSERVTDDGSVHGIADFRLRPPTTVNEDR
jgi:hypothetical protein